MAINRSSFTTESLTTNHDIAIQMVALRPDPQEPLVTPVKPNIMVGFYNTSLNVVELFISNSSGTQYLKVM